MSRPESTSLRERVDEQFEVNGRHRLFSAIPPVSCGARGIVNGRKCASQVTPRLSMDAFRALAMYEPPPDDDIVVFPSGYAVRRGVTVA